jgi:hypothetical protein
MGEQKARPQEKPAPGTVQVHVVITDEALQADKELPPLQREDVKVKQGKNFLGVTQVIPAEGANAALQLMILIDDTLNTSLGNNLTDLKNFISAQPPSRLAKYRTTCSIRTVSGLYVLESRTAGEKRPSRHFGHGHQKTLSVGKTMCPHSSHM